MTQPIPSRSSPSTLVHGHEKYKVALAVVGAAAILLGALLGVTLSNPSQSHPELTFTHGKVTADGFRPIAIQFFRPSDSRVGNLSSAVGVGSQPNSYQLYLVPGKLYGIQVFYNGTSPTTTRCFPGTITPSGTNETQDFAC